MEKNRVEAVQFRIARPTDNFEAVVKFYGEGLGLKKLDSFSNHEGYDGVMFGLPDSRHHLEFTHHVDGSPCPAPTKDNLLVLYFDSPEKYKKAVAQLEGIGLKSVDPENPYWKDKSKTYVDPDGWRVVLFNGPYNP